MKRFAQTFKAALIALLASSVLGQTNISFPVPKDIKLLPETVKLRPSKLPGYQVATQQCAICHSADYIAYQPPGMSRTQWTAEAAKMHATYGAPIGEADIKSVGTYLAATYGDAKSISPAESAASTPVVLPARTAVTPALTPTR